MDDPTTGRGAEDEVKFAPGTAQVDCQPREVGGQPEPGASERALTAMPLTTYACDIAPLIMDWHF